MKINVDALTDAEVAELQDHQWDPSEYEGKKDTMSVAMRELCENMRSMPIASYRNYLRTVEARWEEVNA